MSTLRRTTLLATGALALLLLSLPAGAQYNERPDAVGTGSSAVDCSGRSIKNMRVRAVHTDDPSLEGGTAYFIARDPFLAYQLGRNLNFREFRLRDGVFSAATGKLGGPMPDGSTAKITVENHTSCLGCHNLPQGNPGGGTNFHKDSGRGRNAPHYYGAGIVEMLALQVRADMLQLIDLDGSGWISAAEAAVAPPRILVPATSGVWIDYGSAHLSSGATGTPSLDNIFRVWFVDAAGRHVPGAHEVDGLVTFGYDFEMVVWGWGQGHGRAALNPTNRAFFWDPANSHSGLEAHDPSTTDDPEGDGVSVPTLAGAVQFPATHVAPDAGADLDPLGFSRDDPDGDGHLNELSEGDLDLAEWFMLNAPRPAFAGPAWEYAQGVRAMDKLGCTECHVANWTIAAADDVHAGDRRLFDFDVRWNTAHGRLEGRLVPLYTKNGPDYEREYGSFEVVGLFSDLRHHEMGERFAELDFGGTKNTVWRTPPLWGVGAGFPWGHDGASMSIRHAILRHGGEAAASRAAFERASEGMREKLLTFLSKLALYDIESLPADVDGDGILAENFTVGGMDTGPERFNAEWRFEIPLVIQGWVTNMDGVAVRSQCGMNIDAAYGALLPYRVDSDGDGWPDVWDHAPHTPGFKDGVTD